jgi:hypothetical protein
VYLVLPGCFFLFLSSASGCLRMKKKVLYIIYIVSSYKRKEAAHLFVRDLERKKKRKFEDTGTLDSRSLERVIYLEHKSV